MFPYHEKNGNQHNINVPIIIPSNFVKQSVIIKSNPNNRETYQVFEQPCVHVETL